MEDFFDKGYYLLVIEDIGIWVTVVPPELELFKLQESIDDQEWED